ncbi:MAG: hypothetical protein GW772_06560 [Flavobacteriia bacterium]|nr:hypothetical protein [Flavobacteriia bacterium]OIP45151.1 MAG: hypothetical protein AUK46_13220 [Flavobacteriaceae bacterium CG2_30_31_66]PIV95344.1 MAG: hypothetical protein COW43_14135 [Flavobacteriaceae bacterium CG17_big_fil_post_rev_8_21_14_2_50_31_13]PIY13670.1 MAG: hypothetical protein COZ16_13310 [Flavobacteriaceae bacterium CG_4_10_14_3_um_filter_31_253]PIZ11866.1 MAG: hypothetical protein COY55_03135 [Flavobacteriaceae bacterium CG_4_10_14_0_8_um_filter_31_99]PJC09046.1 MAG: hypot
MKKIFTVLVFFCIISSCEKDDFCTQNPVTPKLILRFYDNLNRTQLKNVDQLYVWASGKDSLFVNQSTDSISIPLNTIANETVYNFSRGNIVNQFTIRYTPQQIYVSRSCGFKVNFDEVSYISNNTWIADFEATTTIINNQNAAHVQIFH